jgi:hypothetical protein
LLQPGWSFPNETQIKLHISSIEYSTTINAWISELAYYVYARHGVSSQRRVQELDVSLRHLFTL